MSIRDEARAEAERLYGAPVADRRDDWIPSQRRSAFEAGAAWASEQTDREPSEAEVEAFREGWNQADAEGDKGNRVRQGLLAAQEVRARG